MPITINLTRLNHSERDRVAELIDTVPIYKERIERMVESLQQFRADREQNLNIPAPLNNNELRRFGDYIRFQNRGSAPLQRAISECLQEIEPLLQGNIQNPDVIQDAALIRAFLQDINEVDFEEQIAAQRKVLCTHSLRLRGLPENIYPKFGWIIPIDPEHKTWGDISKFMQERLIEANENNEKERSEEIENLISRMCRNLRFSKDSDRLIIPIEPKLYETLFNMPVKVSYSGGRKWQAFKHCLPLVHAFTPYLERKTSNSWTQNSWIKFLTAIVGIVLTIPIIIGSLGYLAYLGANAVGKSLEGKVHDLQSA